MLPTLNQMAAAGIITLPGIMTGQVLAGMDPLEAGKYQILLMFVLAAAGFLGCGDSLCCLGHLTDGRHRLRLDRSDGANDLSFPRSPYFTFLAATNGEDNLNHNPFLTILTRLRAKRSITSNIQSRITAGDNDKHCRPARNAAPTLDEIYAKTAATFLVAL